MNRRQPRPAVAVASGGRDEVVANGHRAPRYLIGDVAALTSLSVHALRAWEREGLLAPHRSPGGVRQYSEDDVARVRLIARTLGSKGVSRRVVAALLQSGDLCPDPADYAPQPMRSQSSQSTLSDNDVDAISSYTADTISEAVRSRRLLDAIAHIGEAVAAGRPLTVVLTDVCRQCCRAFGISDAVLWLLETRAPPGASPAAEARSDGREQGDSTDTLVVAAAYGPRSRSILGANPPLRVPLDNLFLPAGRVSRLLHGLVVETQDILPDTHPELRELLPAAALLVVPLTTTGGPVGVLALREALDSGRFDAEDIERARLFANQAAIAIDIARLHEEARVAREHERRHVQREICLAAVTRAALGAMAPSTFADHAAHVLEALVEHAGLPVVTAGLNVIDPVTGSVTRAGGPGVGLADFIGAVPGGSHPIWQAMNAGPAFSTDDGSPPMMFAGEAPEKWTETGIRAWAVAPLRGGSTLLGTLTLGLGVPHQWDTDERAWFEACAAAVALAIQNAQLFAAGRRRTQELEAVLESVDEGISMVTASGQILVRNARAAALTARPTFEGTLVDISAAYGLRDPVTGTPIQMEHAPVYRALHGEAVRDALLIMRNGAGQDRLMHSSSNPVRDSTGAIIGAVSTFRDVTAQTRRARLFEHLSKHLGTSLEPAAEMCTVVNALVELGGLDTAAVYSATPDGQNLHLMAACNYPPEVVALVKHVPIDTPSIGALALRTGRPQLIQHVSEHDDVGQSFTRRVSGLLGVSSVAALPLLARGRVLGVIVVCAVEPERFPPETVDLLLDLAVRAGLALDNALLYQTAREMAAKLDATIEAMTESVVVCDATGKLTHVNHAAAAILGVPQEQAVHLSREHIVASMFHLPNGQPVPADDSPLARGLRGETAADYRMMARAGGTATDRQLRVSYGPIRDDFTGAIVGAVVVARDFTSMAEVERAREEFLAVASHELKTPLTSLLGFIQTARRKARGASASQVATQDIALPVDPGAVDGPLLARIERQALRLDRLVSDLLDVVRIQQGRLEYRWAVGDVAGAVAEAVDEQRVAHPDRTIELVVPEEALPARLDADRLSQVVTNLLTNALKYSHVQDPAVVTVTADRRTEDGARVAVVRVRDHGPGIPHEYLSHVFERFYRVPGVDVQSGSGIGLGVGLHVAREIVERHGGSIWAESEPGQGSTFAFTIALD